DLGRWGGARRAGGGAPGGGFRRSGACRLQRLEGPLAWRERGTTGPGGGEPGYRTADELISDLRVLEAGLAAVRCMGAVEHLVRPVRRGVETFRFSTFRLDMRENSLRSNEAPAALWRAGTGGG